MPEQSTQLPGLDRQKTFKTERNDRWWIVPAITFSVLSAFVVYATFRTFEGKYYEFQNYLSPFYSPTIVVSFEMFGHKIHISPALWILPFPLTFRFTCYYYRKAYYRAFFWDPPACAVGEAVSRKDYSGESRFPLVLQNVHRYAWYFTVIIIAILWWDTLRAFVWQGGFRVGIGSVVFLINILLLTGYTFGCHAWRHMAGGCVNCYSCSDSNRKRYWIWEKVTRLNEKHGTWAWFSLTSVALTDFYVRCLCTGLFREVRLF
ncbi:MAG: hypothetical protein WAN11_04390 [Syntrophobacteraceae bacterium]